MLQTSRDVCFSSGVIFYKKENLDLRGVGKVEKVAEYVWAGDLDSEIRDFRRKGSLS